MGPYEQTVRYQKLPQTHLCTVDESGISARDSSFPHSCSTTKEPAHSHYTDPNHLPCPSPTPQPGFSLLGIFAPPVKVPRGNLLSQEQMFPGTFVPTRECSKEL